jgi:hypothetical protein
LRAPVVLSHIALGITIAGCGAKADANLSGHIRTMFSTGELRAAAHGRAGLIRIADAEKALQGVCDRYRGQRHDMFARHNMLDAEDTTSAPLPSTLEHPRPLPPPSEVIAVMDSAAHLARTTEDQVDSALVSHSVVSVETDAAGNYSIPQVGSGDYALWAINTFGKVRLIWWQPLKVSPGANAIDLDTRDATAGRKYYCEIPI